MAQYIWKTCDKKVRLNLQNMSTLLKRNLIPDKELGETLKFLCSEDELDRKFLVIKDAHLYFEDPTVITCLKSIALKISSGLDATVIIVSSILKFPKELEKFITILEMDYPDQNEIKVQISAFAKEQGVSGS